MTDQTVFPSPYCRVRTAAFQRRTPHTPRGVNYYLDQASRAQSVGANSAAITMYRAALEHLLFDQGFKKGMCGTKLKDLQSAVASEAAPPWAKELAPDFLHVMKELGDGAVHPNDGNVTGQSSLDTELLASVQATFSMLLFLVYEAPYERQDHLDKLTKARAMLKKTGATTSSDQGD